VGTKVYCPYFFYLVEHPDGRILFDTGLHPEIATDPVGRIGEAAAAFPIEMNEDGDVVSQLGKLGLAPGDVDAVIVSHLHFDHAGGLEFVKHAPVYVQGTELAVARNPPVYQRGLYNPADFEHDLKWKQLDGDADVFGDGKLRVISTPGHTPGHQSIYVEFERRKPLVLMGDATYSLAKMRQRRLSAVVWSPDAMVASCEGVGDDVVQLACDPQPLLLGAPPPVLLATALGELEPFVQEPYVGAMVAQRLTGEDGNGDQGGMPHGLQGQRVRPSAGEEDLGNGDRDGGGEGPDGDLHAAAHQGQGVEGRGRRDDGGRAGAMIDGEEDEHEPARDRERDRRRTPAKDEHARRRQRERDRERSVGRIGAHRRAADGDRPDEHQHRSVDRPREVALHGSNLPRTPQRHVLPRA
jgi:glyoxylase-like metal-dependent hydrolase (beta-lactamase superfamily II)